MWKKKRSWFKVNLFSRQSRAMACAGAVIFGSSLSHAVSLSWDQADVIWIEEYRTYYGIPNVSGDFNGDGRTDLVFTVEGKATVVLGRPFASSALYGSMVNWTIIFPDSFKAESIQAGDLNGDGKADLIFGFPDYQASAGRVLVVFGRAGSGGVIDLGETTADVEIRGQNFSNLGFSLAVGNFNGDAYRDVLLGVEGFHKVYVLWGAAVISPAFVDLNAGGVLTSITGPGPSLFGSRVAAGDMNGDGKSEAVISASNLLDSVFVVWGSTTLATAPQLKINGVPFAHVESPALGNFDGDQRADILLRNSGGIGNTFWTSVLMGDWLPSVSTTVNTSPGLPGYLAPVGLGIYGDYQSHPFPPVAVGDFDGDGRDDVMGLEWNSTGLLPVRGFLSSFHPGAWSPGDTFNDPSLEIDVNGVGLMDKRVTLGDVNNDGLADLVVTRVMNPTYSPTQYLIFYGFRPLRNPQVQVTNPVSGARVDLLLEVEGGEPHEMKLGGAIIDSFRDQWIPFASHHGVTLSPSLESKTVTALFRTAGNRESDLAQTTVTLEAEGGSEAKFISNRLRPNGRVVVECPMETAGRLRISIWTSDGNPVADLLDEDRGPGVWTLEWDGKNKDGKRVSPGVYIMRLENNGHVEQKKILVQG